MKVNFKVALYSLAGIIMLVLVCNNVKKTCIEVAAYYSLQKAIEENGYAFRSVEELRAELKQYNAHLGYVSADHVSNQNRLISHISEYSNLHNARISLLPHNYSEEGNGYEVETNIVQFEGDYKDVLELLYEIEQEHKMSKIVSANFEVKEDWTSKTRKLFSTVYFQNIKIR